MQRSKARRLILFILGEYYRCINKKFKTPFLKVSLSKTEYIDVVRRSGVVSKQARAVYKNLEDLEKDRLIIYDHHMLKFTAKGKREYEGIRKEIDSYNAAAGRLEEKARSLKKGQMVFMPKN
jgi:hypothetical protein